MQDGKLDSANEKFGLALSDNVMDIGAFTASGVRFGSTPQSIVFDDDVHGWRTSINGVWLGNENHNMFAVSSGDYIQLETGIQCL